MDDQNFLEKVGILKEIGEIKNSQSIMSTQLENLIEQKKEHHERVMLLINRHEMELYGPPHPGIKMELDRLLQWKTGLVATWAIVLPLAFKVIYDWVKGRG